jgi:DNA recombination protein RmuC
MSEAKGDVEKKQQAIDAMVKPIRELLEKHSTAVHELEKKREVAYKGLEEQIKHIIAANEKLDRETGRLVSALRRPEQRGRWGEMQLRNVVELAGMTEHCDFDEQPMTDDPTTRDRPDMTVHMPGGGRIVVDAKVALDAYLDALQPDADRDALMRRHGDQVQSHYKRLAAKQYWEQFDRTPKLVVMFMPLESALVAALESKPTLHADAMQNHVLIATPTLLVALLRAVAYGWQQEAVAENARDIARVGGELHERIAVFVRHFEKVGANLEKATKTYNDAVGSMESRVLPSTRKLEQLRVNTGDEIDSPAPIEIECRPLTSEEGRSLSARHDA